MKRFIGFEHGMGIGGWLTNYKRFHVLPQEKRKMLTIGDFEHFDSYITERDVAYIASLGMDHIRLGFDQLVVESEPYCYRDHIFDLIRNFVDWCRKYNLNVVLNLHKAIGNYCDISEPVSLFEDEDLQNRVTALWVEFEKRFASYPEVAFELLNEVTNADPEKWDHLAQKTLLAIRERNPIRKVIIGGRGWNAAWALEELRVYEDENVIYTFHMYEPHEFTHQRGVLQAGPAFYNRDMPYPCEIERYRDYARTLWGNQNAYPQYTRMDAQFIRDRLSCVLDFMKEHPDAIVWCGEFGTIRHAKTAWRENYMRDVIRFLKDNEIPYCVWNYLSTPNDGNRFSLVDDDRREIVSEEMARIIRGEVY